MIQTIHNEKLLHAIDFGILYKKRALKYEKTCIATCKSYGYNKFNMIKCAGCQNSYHYKCLEKETGITLDHLKRNDMKLMCNIEQPCLYPRNQQFIKTWLKKFGTKKINVTWIKSDFSYKILENTNKKPTQPPKETLYFCNFWEKNSCRKKQKKQRLQNYKNFLTVRNNEKKLYTSFCTDKLSTFFVFYTWKKKYTMQKMQQKIIHLKQKKYTTETHKIYNQNKQN